MSPTPIDQRTIDPELRADIEAAYANVERQQTNARATAVASPNTRPFIKPLRNDAVVELTARAKEQSKQPDINAEALAQVYAYTKYINDLRDNRLRNQ
jgi:hypothetical protein